MTGVSAWALLLLHLAFALSFSLWNFRKRDRIQATVEAVVVLALPGLGLLLALGCRILCAKFHLEKRQLPMERPEEEPLFLESMAYDGNIVPLNDTFLMEDAKKKRELFTTAIKQDALKDQETLRMALNDDDRETAYYAVSLLTTQMEQLESQLFEAEGKLQQEQESEHLEDLEEYAGLLREYLSHEKFIDHVTFQQKKGVYLGILDRLVSLLPERKEYYMEEFQELIAGKDFATASEVCKAFQEHFPEDEDSYLMYIRLYQAMRDPGKLQAKIAELKACPIRLSVEAMRVIRYWDRGAQHG